MAGLHSRAKSSSSLLTSCVQLSVTTIKNIGIKQESHDCRNISLLEKEVNHVTVTVAASQNKGSVASSVLLEMFFVIVAEEAFGKFL